jgi:hypothetical protein
MLVAVVLVLQTRVTRIGCHPTGRPAKVTIPPPNIVTRRLPPPPMNIAVDADARSTVSLGVTVAA